MEVWDVCTDYTAMTFDYNTCSEIIADSGNTSYYSYMYIMDC